MKLTDEQLENLLLQSFDSLDKTKEACKVTISQCLQAPDPITTMNLAKSCLETIDASELCKMFILNKSPNIKNSVGFTLKVLKTNSNECKKLFNNDFSKNMAKFCYKSINNSADHLHKLYQAI